MNPLKQKIKLFIVVCIILPHAVALGQSDSFPQPAYQWRCTDGNSLLNFNPTSVASQRFDSIPYAEEYTMVVVYKPVADTEAMAWRLSFGDEKERRLTTHRIFSGSTAIRYTEFYDNKPVIHTLRQFAPETTIPYARLEVGDGNLKIAEVLYYNYRLGNLALRRVQTALALRYGITLGPVNYLAGDGAHIWEPARDSGTYHHRVAGVGVDTLSGLRQLRSCSEMEGGMVTLSVDDLVSGSFLVFGDNNEPLAFDEVSVPESGLEFQTLKRIWKIQATSIETTQVSLSFNTRNMTIPDDSLVLLVDNYIFLPAEIGHDSIVFRGVVFPTDSSRFTLGRGADLWRLAQSNAKGGNNGNGDKEANDELLVKSHFAARVYPNPSRGHYTIEVSGAERIQVTIYNVKGAVEATFREEKQDLYRFEGDLPSGNVYYATVTTESGSQTMKLVVE